MLQRGIETPDMDVRWVSSLSWYFLNFFGLNGLYRLILGSENCMFTSLHLFSLRIRDRSCAFFSHSHFDSLSLPLQIHSQLSDPSDWRLLAGDFLIAASLLCCEISHCHQSKLISGLPIVARDGRSVCRGDAAGSAWTTHGLSQDLFGRTGQPPIR